MLQRSLRLPKTAAVAIPRKWGVAHPRGGGCMVPFYINYYLITGSAPGAHDLAS
jgi:hypothetical protein